MYDDLSESQYVGIIETERLKQNVLRLLYVSAFSAVWEFIMVFVSVLGQAYYPPNIRPYYIAAYVFYLGVNTAALLIANTFRRRKLQSPASLRMFGTLVNAYAVISVLWGMGITILDQQMYKQIIAFLIPFAVTSSILNLKPRFFCAMSVSSTVLLLVVLYSMMTDDIALFLGHVVNLSILITLLLAVHFFQYRTFCENERSKIRIKELSYRDALTGLKNRRYMQKYIEDLCAGSVRISQPLSAAMIDIDHFKNYNDTYGHLQGDVLLTAIGEALDEAAERYSAAAFRYGGEEFLVLAHGNSMEQTQQMAADINGIVQRRVSALCSNPQYGITLSIGVSYTRQTADINDVYRAIDSADGALYTAKRGGRDRIVIVDDGLAASH